MITLVKGMLRQEAAKLKFPWWLGRVAHCPNCGGQFKLEKNDSVNDMNQREDLPPHAEVVCPTVGCSHIIWLRR
jgi:hypothetical protein